MAVHDLVMAAAAGNVQKRWFGYPLPLDWGAQIPYAIVWNGSIFCVVGQGGRCATSPNGVTWTYQPSLGAVTSNVVAFALAWNGSVFLAGCANGKVATSPDGVNWTLRSGLAATSWSTRNVGTIAWTGTLFVVGGDEGSVATSPDGITWTFRPGLQTTAWGSTAAHSAVLSLSWNGSVLCAVGQDGKAATSPDGVTWTFRPSLQSAIGASESVTELVWDRTFFIAGTQSGKVARSADGASWSFVSTLWAGTRPITTLSATSDSTLFAAGFSGLTGFSSNGTTWVEGSLLTVSFMEGSTCVGNVVYVASYATSGPLVYHYGYF